MLLSRFWFISLIFFAFSVSVSNAVVTDYLPGRVILKIEDPSVFFKNQEHQNLHKKDILDNEAIYEAFRSGPESLISHYMKEYEGLVMRSVFRSGASSGLELAKRTGSQPQRMQELALELERTFNVLYTSGEDPLEVSRKLARQPGVVYAEPHYIHTLTEGYTPNDPRIGDYGHDHFEYHNFLKAWEVTKGSSDVVIAIVDSGVYYDHPDLKNKLWHNPEPGRANDFFVWEIENDTIGWNFWESGDVFRGEEPIQNANPVGNYSTHGTHVAGIAAADTDNEIGIAGTGFNSRFMPVKTGGTKDYPRNIVFGYDGILYAAINQADIINCSFGGTGFSHYGQDVVDFATASGSLVVAAAGNNGTDTPFYPAAFKNALSVGSVRINYDDVISHFSNYGYYLDVFALGQSVLSTHFSYNSNEVSWSPSYQLSTGTSMAAPVVSGLAALLKAKYPAWPPERIATQIRTNARSIHAANTHFLYENRLGKGLIDAHAALTNLKPGLRITDYSFEKEEGRKINIGESGTVTLEGFNFGTTASAAIMTLDVDQSGIRLEPEENNAGILPANQPFSLSFDVEITSDFDLLEIPAFRLDMSDEATAYDDFFMFEYERILFDVIDINQITTSISSDGTIGFIESFSSYGGIGFIPGDHENVLYEGALMITAVKENTNGAFSKPLVINQARDSTKITRHFKPEKNFRFLSSNLISDLDGRALFSSSGHPVANALSIELKSYAFTSSTVDQSVIVTYKVTNHSPHTFHDMHIGLFNDWDIRDYDNDYTAFIEDDSLLYAYDAGGGPYVAVAHLGPLSSAFAINNLSPLSLPDAQNREDSLRFGINYRDDQPNYDGFTDAEKHLALTAGTERTTLQDTDISIVTASGPFTLPPSASVKTGFLYAWGEDLPQLRNQVAQARALELFSFHNSGEYEYIDELPDRLTLHQNYPNPFNASTILKYHVPNGGKAHLAVYNILGQRVATLVDEVVNHTPQSAVFNAAGLSSGVYIAILRGDGGTAAIKMNLLK